MDNLIVKIVARWMIPFIQVYGLYIIIYGHLSPGGGFAGGAVLASSLILLLLAFDLKEVDRKISSKNANSIESGSAIIYTAIGLWGIMRGVNFLSNRSAGFPIGTPGHLFSGGMVAILSIVIGFKVASTMITLFRHLIEEGGESDA